VNEFHHGGQIEPLRSVIAQGATGQQQQHRAAAAAAGSPRPPAALAPISAARARQAAADQRAAGTAVEPRTQNAPHAATIALMQAATQATPDR
jgi:hypothetical protein